MNKLCINCIPKIESLILNYNYTAKELDTTFFKKSNDEYKIIKTVEPKKGRFVVFDGKYYHAGRHPNDHDTRLVINFNFI